VKSVNLIFEGHVVTVDDVVRELNQRGFSQDRIAEILTRCELTGVHPSQWLINFSAHRRAVRESGLCKMEGV